MTTYPLFANPTVSGSSSAEEGCTGTYNAYLETQLEVGSQLERRSQLEGGLQLEGWLQLEGRLQLEGGLRMAG